MINYFKLLQPLADLDDSYKSIKDITIALAKSAGYHRGLRLLKNGKLKERALYTDKFDDILTARWLCYYKKLFIAKLIKHPELSEYHVSIINDTFKSVMQSLDIEKIKDDDCINKYTNMTLGCKIGIAMIDRGSLHRLADHQNGGKRKFYYKTILNHNSISLDSLIENGSYGLEPAYESIDTSPLLLDLKSQLSNNKYGLRLLEAMLTSRKKIMLNHIDDFVLIDKNDFNDSTKRSILDAYNKICATLVTQGFSSSESIHKRRTVKFSFENRS